MYRSLDGTILIKEPLMNIHWMYVVPTYFFLFRNNNLADLLSETYAASELNRYYLVGVVKQNSSINSFQDLQGKTTCNAAPSKYDFLSVHMKLHAICTSLPTCHTFTLAWSPHN